MAIFKSLLALFALVSVTYCGFIEDNQAFESFKKQFNRIYESKDEQDRRFSIFVTSLRRNEKINADESLTYKVGLSHFSDLTSIERKARLMPDQYVETEAVTQTPLGSLPTIDWRTKKYVTPVQNQGDCGSCWAFTACAALEVDIAMHASRLELLSPQNLVDCDTRQDGCRGGRPETAYNYIKNGISAASAYPYKAVKQSCKNVKKVVKVSGYSCIRSGDEAGMQSRIKSSALTVGIDADQYSFQVYKSGVYYDKACRNNYQSHAVTVVGMGTQSGSDYYLVKNSWGTSWGESGYIKMAANRGNHCSIASTACYPTGSKRM